jgi:CheY-like chemotaxis protein
VPLTPSLTDVLDAAIAMAKADFGTLQRLDRSSGLLKIVAHRGFEPWWLEYWDVVDKGQGSCGTALVRREPVIVSDVDKDPIFVGTPGHAVQRNAGVRACFSMPIPGRAGGTVGMMSTHFRSPFTPAPALLKSMEPLCLRAAEIFERADAPPLVLLVDDDGDVRASFKEALEARGCDVVEAKTGKRALHYLTSDAPLPSLVLSDVTMPEMGGWELATIIGLTGRLSSIPVMLMSSMETARHSRGQGPLLIKPVGRAAMDRFFDEILEQLRASLLAPPPAEVTCGQCGASTPKRPSPVQRALTFCRSCGAPVRL